MFSIPPFFKKHLTHYFIWYSITLSFKFLKFLLLLVVSGDSYSRWIVSMCFVFLDYEFMFSGASNLKANCLTRAFPSFTYSTNIDLYATWTYDGLYP